MDPQQRQQLRDQFLQRAGQAFDRMFDEAEQDALVTFTQREDRACLLGQDMIAWLLQQHVNTDAAAQADAQHPAPCPRCHRPGRLLTEPDQPLPRRPLTTRAGEIHLQRRQWYCATCRVAFFPSGPQAPAGDGGL